MTGSEENQFHAHDVLDMLSFEKQALALPELKNLIIEKFGANAQFGSCSMSGMDADQIVQFLLARQKIVEVEPGKFKLNSHNSCGH